jgi:dCTP deaminase
MSIYSDRDIRSLGYAGMIEPFEPTLVRSIDCTYVSETNPDKQMKVDLPMISYGTSSYGYDLRLSPRDFQLFQHIPGTIMDPKAFNPANLAPATLYNDPSKGSYFVIPAHSYGLGVALERLRMPRNVTAVAVGKSTYARMGIIVNTTPAEAGWGGHLTLELSNSSGADCRIYAGEGICQLLFFEGSACDVSYSDRKGKYQHQSEQVTHARV